MQSVWMDRAEVPWNKQHCKCKQSCAQFDQWWSSVKTFCMAKLVLLGPKFYRIGSFQSAFCLVFAVQIQVKKTCSSKCMRSTFSLLGRFCPSGFTTSNFANAVTAIAVSQAEICHHQNAEARMELLGSRLSPWEFLELTSQEIHNLPVNIEVNI